MSKYQALIDAIDAGPTKGPWVLSKYEYHEGGVPVSIHANVYPEKTRAQSICGQKSNRINGRTNQRLTDLAYIAEANPATIRALLADLERAEKALREVVAVFDSNPSSICDTVWVTGNRPETLYDHCRDALAQMAGGG